MPRRTLTGGTLTSLHAETHSHTPQTNICTEVSIVVDAVRSGHLGRRRSSRVRSTACGTHFVPARPEPPLRPSFR